MQPSLGQRIEWREGNQRLRIEASQWQWDRKMEKWRDDETKREMKNSGQDEEDWMKYFYNKECMMMAQEDTIFDKL